MRTEISQAKRENAHYLENVSKGKEIEAIIGRKRKKGEEVSAGNECHVSRHYYQLFCSVL